ncbi:MAG: hypothetical protein V1842_01320 [Candidatus Omnitrophota bacterium]
MRNNPSPEEKLLWLIKGQKKKPGETKPLVKSHPRVSVKMAALGNFFSGLSLQRVIWIVFILGSIYLFYLLIYPLSAFKKNTLSQTAESGSAEISLELDRQKKPIDFYRQEIARRPIFNSAREPAAGQGPVSGVDMNLTKDINLVGIISGEPTQAIIEDLKTKRTYYVTKGQFIGELKVDDIQKGKIILNYNGQRYELYL